MKSDHVEQVEGLAPDIEDLALFFAKIISSKHNQHAIVMIVGSAGKGKSWAGISLAIEVSKKLAEILKGNPEDYFNFDKTFATISKDEVKRVMTNPLKHTILLLDDVAAKAMNARNFNDRDNIDFNSLLTTFRPNHNLVILTAQAGFLLDKVPRNISHFIIEMEESLFDYGITIAKVKEVVYKHSTGKLHFPYLQSNGAKYVRHIFYAPDSKITKEYEEKREYQLSHINDKDGTEEKESPLSKFDLFKTPVKNLKATGLSQVKIGRVLGISQGWVSRILNESKNIIITESP